MKTKIVLQCLKGQKPDKVPVWLMRQAGRYLPEYHEIRNKAGSFLNLCYTPKLATQVTLQPLKRFDLDASIFFADILVIPDALGQKVDFQKNIGPVLQVPEDKTAFLRTMELHLSKIHTTLNPLYETLDRLTTEIPKKTTLIGFSGCPWTIATYMILGKGKQNLQKCIQFAEENPDFWQMFYKILVESIADYCIYQIYAGAEVIQLFESWAGALYGDDIAYFSINPIHQIIAKIKSVHPVTPIIVFPKDIRMDIDIFKQKTGADAISLTDIRMVTHSDKKYPVQGCLDPAILQSGENLEQSAYDICMALKNRPHIFNLSHGIDKKTPILHVHRLIDAVKNV